MIVAVSGGVDSVVLLHKLIQAKTHECIVAHFDHGIRPESDADARFVESLAKSYGLVFETRREELGVGASELLARTRRYMFLRELAQKYDADIMTAHHADDVIETIAINLHRGTGWRGLAVLDAPNIRRPLAELTKQQIYDYAVRCSLEWVEDETNATDTYLRNRLRAKLNSRLSPASKKKLLGLWADQKRLKREIDEKVEEHVTPGKKHSRYFFTHIDEKVALELLRVMMHARTTRPQLERGLHAIKTARHGASVDIGSGIVLTFTTTDFVAEIPQ